MRDFMENRNGFFKVLFLVIIISITAFTAVRYGRINTDSLKSLLTNTLLSVKSSEGNGYNARYPSITSVLPSEMYSAYVSQPF